MGPKNDQGLKKGRLPYCSGIGLLQWLHATTYSLYMPPRILRFAQLAQPFQSSPIWQSGRPTHRPFRSLLGVHSLGDLRTRAVTNSRHADRRLQPLRSLSMTAPIASGWSVGSRQKPEGRRIHRTAGRNSETYCSVFLAADYAAIFFEKRWI
jgi:hypothetical protein